MTPEARIPVIVEGRAEVPASNAPPTAGAVAAAVAAGTALTPPAAVVTARVPTETPWPAAFTPILLSLPTAPAKPPCNGTKEVPTVEDPATPTVEGATTLVLAVGPVCNAPLPPITPAGAELRPIDATLDEIPLEELAPPVSPLKAPSPAGLTLPGKTAVAVPP